MDKSYSRRLQLNSAIFKNPYWVLPVEDEGRSNFEPVGRGVQTSPLCGRWVGVNTCKNVSKHEGIVFRGVDYTGKVVVHRHLWCFKSSCPVCFIRGWSKRGACNVDARVNTGVKRGLGKVEHVMVSVSEVDRDLPESVFRKKCRKILLDCGVSGCMIFHGFRRDKERNVLVWRPHYHVLGFIEGGYARCRDCGRKWDCLKGCGGFDDRAWQTFQKSGYYVKVFAERGKSYYEDKDNIFGTAYYQLNHATIKLGVKRFHAVTWFGVCGNRKFESEKVDVKVTCPLCCDEMGRSVYVGKERIVKDVGHPDYKAVFPMSEFGEDGEPNFIDVV